MSFLYELELNEFPKAQNYTVFALGIYYNTTTDSDSLPLDCTENLCSFYYILLSLSGLFAEF